MTRKEMIKDISAALSEVDGLGADIDNEDRAHHILTKIEDVGMMPPHTKVINCNCYDHNWEPENDN